MPLNAVYTHEQREAIEQAWLDRQMRPARRICELAAAGLLTCDGVHVPSFTIPRSSVSTIGNEAKRRWEGKAKTALRNQSRATVVETMRQRLTSLTDHELKRVERGVKGNREKAVDPQWITRMATSIARVASLPAPDELRLPLAPGQHDPWQPNGGPKGADALTPMARQVIAAVEGHGTAYQPPQSPASTERNAAPHASPERADTPLEPPRNDGLGRVSTRSRARGTSAC